MGSDVPDPRFDRLPNVGEPARVSVDITRSEREMIAVLSDPRALDDAAGEHEAQDFVPCDINLVAGAQRLQARIDEGHVLLCVRLPDHAAEERAGEILARHSSEELQVHDFTARLAKG